MFMMLCWDPLYIKMFQKYRFYFFYFLLCLGKILNFHLENAHHLNLHQEIMNQIINIIPRDKIIKKKNGVKN